MDSHLVGGGGQASALCVCLACVLQSKWEWLPGHSNMKQGRLQFLCCFSPQVTVLCTLESDESANSSFIAWAQYPTVEFPHLMGFG